ncbi:MAG: hypothetical protein ACJ74U_14750 [Jatrophihabitantaceae bacterium]
MLLAITVLLAACGSGAVTPTRSPTGSVSRSVEASATRSVETSDRSTDSPPTQAESSTRAPITVETRSTAPAPVQTVTQTQAAPPVQQVSPTPTPKQTAVVAVAETDSSTPAWVWWLLAALVLAAVITTVLVLRGRHRKQAWREKFGTTTAEVAWFARVLIPRLEQAPTAQQIAGGWRIEANRVVSVEDDLTTLEATALDQGSRGQAATLRDAVRSARSRLTALDTAADEVAARGLLLTAATEVETAMSQAGVAAPESVYPATPR